MDPKNGDERPALGRFLTLLVGGEGRREPQSRNPAPEVGPRRDVPQRAVGQQQRHASDCPADAGDVAICTCGAMFRTGVGNADEVAGSPHAVAKIV